MALLDGFLEFLGKAADEHKEEGQDQIHVSATSLLIHMMDADGVRLDEEYSTLKELLKSEYGVAEAALDQLFDAGEALDRNSVDFYAATRVLSDRLERDEKIGFVEMMWRIIYADGERHEVEDHVLNRIAELIGVERPVQIALRHKVEDELGLR